MKRRRRRSSRETFTSILNHARSPCAAKRFISRRKSLICWSTSSSTREKFSLIAPCSQRCGVATTSSRTNTCVCLSATCARRSSQTQPRHATSSPSLGSDIALSRIQLRKAFSRKGAKEDTKAQRKTLRAAGGPLCVKPSSALEMIRDADHNHPALEEQRTLQQQ